MDMNIFRGERIEFHRHYPDNSNAVTLVIHRAVKTDQPSDQFLTQDEVTIFDLPRSETDKLYAAFGKPTYYIEPTPVGAPMEEIPVEAA